MEIRPPQGKKAETRPRANLDAIIQNARRLEIAGQTSELLHIYKVICQLSLDENKLFLAVSYALKWRMIEPDRVSRVNAVGLMDRYLSRLTESAAGNPGLNGKLYELRDRIAGFVADGLKPAEASPDEKNHWLSIFVINFETRLLAQQLEICDAAFAENSAPMKKGGSATVYALMARRAAKQGIVVDTAKVAAKPTGPRSVRVVGPKFYADR